MLLSAIWVLVTANLAQRPGRLFATGIAIAFAGALLLAALVGRQKLIADSQQESPPILAANELHLTATDPVSPYLDPQFVAQLQADPRVKNSESGTLVRVIDLPGTESGSLDEEVFYDEKGMNGWIPGRSAELMAWEKDGPPLNVTKGRLPAPDAIAPIEIAVPQNQMWNATFDGYRRLESHTGGHAALVVGVTRGSIRGAPEEFRLATRRISPAAARILAGMERPPSNVRIELHRAEDREAFVEQWRARLAESEQRAQLWDQEMIRREGRQKSRRLKSARSAVLTAVLLAGACVICIAFGVQGSAVRERSSQYVLLRNLGANRGLLFALVLAEAVVQGAAGLFGAVVLAWASLAGVSTYAPFLGMPAAPDAVSISWTGVVILAGVLLGSVWPAMNAAGARPSQATRVIGTRQQWRWALTAAMTGLVMTALGSSIVLLSPAGSVSRAQLLTWVGVPAVATATILFTPLLVQVTTALLTTPVAWLTRIDSLILSDQIAEDEARSSGSVVAIAVGLGGFFWVLCWGASMLNSFVIDPEIPRWLASIYPYGLTQEEAERLQSTEPMAGMQPLILVDTRIDGAAEKSSRVDETTPALVMGIDIPRALEGADALPFHFLAGDRNRAAEQLLQENSCLISDWYAASHGVSVGDRVSVIVPDGSAKKVRYEIVGIIDFHGWRMATKQNKVRLNIDSHEVLIVASVERVRSDFSTAYANYFLGNSIPDPDGNVSRFRSDLPSNEAYRISAVERKNLESAIGSIIDLKREIEYPLDHRTLVAASDRAVQIDDLDRTRDALWGDWGGAAVKKMGWAPLCILAISLLSVTGALVASLRSRARELGVLRSCGLTRHGLLRLALAESLLIGATAVPAAAIFGSGGAWIMLEVAEIVGFHMRFTGINPDFVVPWAWLWPGLLLTIIVCGLAALWGGWRISRLSPSTLLSGARGGI